jgi:SulP family sulfate permease
MVNINSGGRTPLSGCINGIAILIIVLVLSPFVRWVPLSVFAGILMVTAMKIVDYNTFNLFKKKSTLESVFIVLTVTAITVVIDLMVAVGVGMVITCLLFVRDQISKT